MASLDDRIHQISVSKSTKTQLLESFWSLDTAPKQEREILDIDAYFAYHTIQCVQALHDDGQHISQCTHHDLTKIADDIIGGLAKEDIKSQLNLEPSVSKLANKNELLESSIDLTARLVSMMDIGELQYGFSGRKQLVWAHGTLKDFIHKYFDTPIVLEHKNVKLEKTFNARNLGRISGIQIEWTDNLTDHLRITDDDDKRVAIFRHASFLKYTQR